MTVQRDRAATPANKLIQGFQDLIKKNPRNAQLRARMGEAYLAQGKIGEAIDAVNGALQVDNKYAGAYLVLGFAQMQNNNANEALKAFLKVIELRENGEYQGEDTSLEQAHFYAGVIYFRQKNYDEAIVHFKSAGRINRASSDTHLYLGKSYAAKQWYGKAMQEYSIAVAFDPKLAEAQYELGRLFERQRDVVRAIVHFRLARDAMPTRPEPQQALDRFGSQDSHYASGQTYLQQKKYPPAVREFKIALAFDDKFVNAHFALGEAFEKTGQKKKAIAEYKLALKYDPGLKDASTALKHLGVAIPASSAKHGGK